MQRSVSVLSKQERLFLDMLLPRPVMASLPDQADLKTLKALALQHGVFPVLYRNLKRLSDLPQVKQFLQENQGLYLRGAVHYIKLQTLEKEILQLFESHHIEAIVLKGSSLAERLYRGYRTSSDIDILIRADDVLKADALLRKNGFIADRIPLRYFLYRFHHTSYIHPGTSVPVEIHWNFGIPYLFNITSEDIWQYCIRDREGNLQLSPELLLIMLIIHHHSHGFKEFRILLDILWCIYAFRDDIDWDGFIALLKKYKLTRSTLVCIYQIQHLWQHMANELDPVKKLQTSLGHSRTLKPLFRAFVIRPSGPPAGEQLYRYKILARFTLDGHLRGICSFFKTLFPSTEAIKALYGLKNSTLVPFYYPAFILWRLKDWLRFL